MNSKQQNWNPSDRWTEDEFSKSGHNPFYSFDVFGNFNCRVDIYGKGFRILDIGTRNYLYWQPITNYLWAGITANPKEKEGVRPILVSRYCPYPMKLRNEISAIFDRQCRDLYWLAKLQSN